MHCWIMGGQKSRALYFADRKFSRELPIHPDFVGKSIDSIVTQKVKVYWGDEKGDSIRKCVVKINNSKNHNKTIALHPNAA